MKNKKNGSVWTLCLAAVVASIQFSHAQESVPDNYESTAVDAADAYELVKACMPSMTESTFKQSVSSVPAGKTSVHSPSDKTKPQLAIANGKVFCVRMSAYKYPILPLSFFDQTITFDDMSKDEAKKLRTDRSRQLAKTGIATALVQSEDGTAYHIGFVFNNNSPNRVYYHGSLLKKGEFDVKDFRAIFQTTGAMTTSSRGPPPENYKSIF